MGICGGSRIGCQIFSESLSCLRGGKGRKRDGGWTRVDLCEMVKRVCGVLIVCCTFEFVRPLELLLLKHLLDNSFVLCLVLTLASRFTSSSDGGRVQVEHVFLPLLLVSR